MFEAELVEGDRSSVELEVAVTGVQSVSQVASCLLNTVDHANKDDFEPQNNVDKYARLRLPRPNVFLSYCDTLQSFTWRLRFCLPLYCDMRLSKITKSGCTGCIECRATFA